MIKKLYSLVISAVAILFFSVPAYAHVIVKPSQIGVAQTQVFTMSVPNEKDSPTTAIKLLIPDGVTQVVPNVKQGWTINIVKKDDTVTEIDWTGGAIPPEQRDEFLFEAQAPGKATILHWKAYQTFGDGSMTSWDHIPTSNPEDDAAPPPYSQTKVMNDLTGITVKQSAPFSDSNKVPTQLSIVALALSAVAIGLSFRKK